MVMGELDPSGFCYIIVCSLVRVLGVIRVTISSWKLGKRGKISHHHMVSSSDNHRGSDCPVDNIVRDFKTICSIESNGSVVSIVKAALAHVRPSLLSGQPTGICGARVARVGGEGPVPGTVGGGIVVGGRVGAMQFR